MQLVGCQIVGVVHGFSSADLVLVVFHVDLQDSFARLVAVHDWHAQVHDDEIKVDRPLQSLLVLRLLVLVELQHALLNLSHGKVAVDGLHHLHFSLRLDQQLYHHELERLIVD